MIHDVEVNETEAVDYETELRIKIEAEEQVKRELQENRISEEREKKIDSVFGMYRREYNSRHVAILRGIPEEYQKSLDVIKSRAWDGMAIKKFDICLYLVSRKQWTTIREEFPNCRADFTIFSFLGAFSELY